MYLPDEIMYLCNVFPILIPVKHCIFLLIVIMLLSFSARAQGPQRLLLPRLEQLSSQHVTQVIQDSEGYLWYATEGGGLCRDDGRQMKVFRSDAEHEDLLCSNDVACVAEAAGRYIIIGTFHGANVLDKHDYSIRRLEEVDDKRVDDILVGRNGHWWLTANKKVFEYSADGVLLNVYPGGDKYIFRLHEDGQGRLWGTEWEGGERMLKDGKLVLVSKVWPRGFDFNRIMTDQQGRLLVADIFGNCYAMAEREQASFFSGQVLTRFMADSVREARGLSDRPTALATLPALAERKEKGEDELWFSTGKDIRRMKAGKEEVILPDTKDVSAMTFTKDSTLWLATIFGSLMTYKDGVLALDEYASNEHGDAVVALQVDSAGRLVIVSDRYVRIYDMERQTLRQQNMEDEGVYRVELQETQPNCRWSQPQEEVMEHLPLWVWWVLAALMLILMVLIIHIWLLHRQRRRFLVALKQEVALSGQSAECLPEDIQTPIIDEWLQRAIAQVEAHMSDEEYSVEQLSGDLCMSRMTFYRKIQSATGQKPTEFIRTIRLRRAAELLREGRMTVTEVSDATGFSSVSYFSRCFRALFGVPPLQFGKMTTKDCEHLLKEHELSSGFSC